MNIKDSRKIKIQSSNFLPLSIALLNESKFYIFLSLIFGTSTAILGLLAIFVHPELEKTWGLLIAVASAICATISFIFFRIYEGKYDLASEAKRLALWEDGLGWVIPIKVFTNINNRAGQQASASAAKLDVSDYYSSKRGPGSRRLLDHLLESSFFTYNLYRNLRNLLGIGLLLLLIILLSIGWTYLVSPTTQDVRILVGRLIVLFIPSILSVGIISWWFKLNDLSNFIESIFKESENVAQVSEIESMRLASEYNCMISRGLPIPGWLYNRNRKYLNHLWTQRRGRRLS